MRSKTIVSRRQFTKRSIATAAVAIVAPQVLGGPRYVAPSDQVHVAVVGVGGRGLQNVRELLQLEDVRITAIADPAEKWDLSNGSKIKQAYINCTQEDIGLVMSPAGLPGRAICGNIDAVRQHDLDNQTRCPAGCLKKCAYKTTGERFCIVQALDRAQQGQVDTGLIFCGTNAYKANRIETVQEIFDELFIEASETRDAI